MKILSEGLKGYVTFLFSAIVFVTTAYYGVHTFVFPRTEAESAIAGISKRMDDAEQNQKEKDIIIRDDLKEIKTKVEKIYDIILEQKKAELNGIYDNAES